MLFKNCSHQVLIDLERLKSTTNFVASIPRQYDFCLCFQNWSSTLLNLEQCRA